MDKQTASASKKTTRSRKPSSRGNGTESVVCDSDLSNLEQVRDLLFGHDLALLHGQLDRLDDQLNQAIRDLEKSVAAQFKKQDRALQSLLSKMDASLDKEGDKRQAGLQKLKQDLQSFNTTNQQMIQQTAQEAAAAEQQLRNDISLLESGLDQAVSEINDKLDNTETLLDGTKTDRALLASLFKSMATEIEKGRQ